MAKITNITELRDDLLTAYDMVKLDPRRANQVKEMVNAAGKIIGTLKMQIEYSVMRGEEPEISFMGETSGRQMGPSLKSLQREVKHIEGEVKKTSINGRG